MNMPVIALSTSFFTPNDHSSNGHSINVHLRGLQRWRPIIWLVTLLCGVVCLGGCRADAKPEPRKITLQQQWALNPGDDIAGNLVTGSLGDISLRLKAKKITAPFDGELEPSSVDYCALYSTPEIPAYLFRLCGLNNVRYGEVKAGKTMGKGDYMSFSTLRQQPDGTWIIVEPAKSVLQKALQADSKS
jgi:hypothetical protein